MSLVSSKVEQDAPDWSLPGLLWVIVATPAFLLATVAAGLFALMILPFVLLLGRQGRPSFGPRRAGRARGNGRFDDLGRGAKQPAR